MKKMSKKYIKDCKCGNSPTIEDDPENSFFRVYCSEFVIRKKGGVPIKSLLSSHFVGAVEYGWNIYEDSDTSQNSLGLLMLTEWNSNR